MDIKYVPLCTIITWLRHLFANYGTSHHGLTLGIGGRLYLAPLVKEDVKVSHCSAMLLSQTVPNMVNSASLMWAPERVSGRCESFHYWQSWLL